MRKKIHIKLEYVNLIAGFRMLSFQFDLSLDIAFRCFRSVLLNDPLVTNRSIELSSRSLNSQLDQFFTFSILCGFDFSFFFLQFFGVLFEFSLAVSLAIRCVHITNI